MRKNKLCVNPKIGEHPDLFERDEEGRPKMTAVWSGAPAEEKHGQYAKDMSKARLRELPRNAFNEEAWAELDADDQEYIREHDAESVARIKALVDAFVEREKYLTEPDEGTQQQWLHDDTDYFAQWLAEQDEIVDDRSVHDEVKELVEKIGGEEVGTHREEQIRGAINEALRDADNYDFSLSGNEYVAEGIYKQRILSAGGIYFDYDRDLRPLTDPMFADEVEEAVEQINHDTYLHINIRDVTRGRDIEIEFEVDYYFVAEPDWDKIEKKARELLGEEEGVEEEVLTPPEERVVYKFSDGFYVVDLLSSELPAEGKAQGICVGKTQYGYEGAVKTGKTKIFSLRRPSGKPLFTIEAKVDLVGMDAAGEKEFKVDRIVQIKGKANRLPGWDAGRDGQGQLKLEEVLKAIEFMDFLGVPPESVRDLQPALVAMKELPPKKNPGRNTRPLGFDSPWTP